MYIRLYDGWMQARPRFSYRTLGLADGSEKDTQLSPQVVNNLTDLVFFARHPELQGKTIQGNQTLEREWSNIKRQFLTPSAGRSTGVVIDLTLPKTDPQPDYSKTADELTVWERARLRGNLSFKFSTDTTSAPRGKSGTYVSLASFKFDNPQFTIFIAKHLKENAFDQTKTRMERQAWYQTLLLIQEHAYVHLKLFRRAAQNMERVLRKLFDQLLPLPSAKTPLVASQPELDAYMKSLGEFLTALVHLELWEKSCGWEKQDYPKLSEEINKAGAVYIPGGLKVMCDPKPVLPNMPVPSVPIKPK
jgi:hypothetical protein